MHIHIFLAHGALGWADEVTALVVGIAVIAYVLVIVVGDRQATRAGVDAPALPIDQDAPTDEPRDPAAERAAGKNAHTLD